MKESVDGDHSDTAFEFVEKEDGESASEWSTYNGPAGASVSSAYDSTHRSNVIECSGDDGNIFIVGDMDGANLNPNDSSWDSTDRVLSFWYRGDWTGIRIALSTVSGTKILYYQSTAGTNYMDGSGNVRIYLGTSAESDSWQRFERNIEADFEAYSTSNAWTNTDGMRIVFGGGDTDFQLDDMRLSNAMTKTFNALTGGSVGQIAATYDFSDGAPVMDVAWYCYDHIGNVQGYSDTGGDLASSTYQDAYGNVLSSITTGQWASTFDGRHLTTKEHDPDAEMYYFWQRWYASDNAIFLSQSEVQSDIEHPYAYCSGSAPNRIDPSGRRDWGFLGGKCCNQSNNNEWALTGDGQWVLLKPGECTGWNTDCDGMTCGGGFYFVSNLQVGTCKTPQCDDKTAVGRRWIPGGPNPPGAKSPEERGGSELPPGYEWGPPGPLPKDKCE